MAQAGVKINGQFVTWSFVAYVRKQCGGDWDMAMDAFYKAKDKTGIVRYIMAGLQPDARNNRYILLPSKTREEPGGMDTIREWWRTCVYTPKTEPMSVGAIFSAIAQGKMS